MEKCAVGHPAPDCRCPLSSLVADVRQHGHHGCRVSWPEVRAQCLVALLADVRQRGPLAGCMAARQDGEYRPLCSLCCRQATRRCRRRYDCCLRARCQCCLTPFLDRIVTLNTTSAFMCRSKHRYSGCVDTVWTRVQKGYYRIHGHKSVWTHQMVDTVYGQPYEMRQILEEEC